MPRTRQKRVAKLIIENATREKPLTAKEIVVNSGYAPVMGKNSHVVMNSAGVKQALNEYGFSEDNAKQVVAQILLNENEQAHNRLKASDQIFKVHGSYAPEKHVNVNLAPEPSDKIKELADKLNK